MRLALGVEYAGTRFCGWARQRGLPSIEQQLAAALGAVADHPVALICGGRTDAGVHALGQVVHFDTPAARSLQAWVQGANRHLPPEIAVRWAQPVPAFFHARFSALRRHYRYWIDNAASRSPFGAGRAALVYNPLDVATMQQAGACLVGEHDFSAFRSADCQSASPVRRLEALQVARAGQWVSVDLCANAFLHHMARNVVGMLLKVGKGERRPEWARELLAGRDRSGAPATAPAAGLYLAAIDYPGGFALPPGGRPAPPV